MKTKIAALLLILLGTCGGLRAQGQNFPGGSSSVGGNASSAGLIDPTSATYGAKADAKSGNDGTTVNGQNTLASTNQACSASDIGKLIIAVNGSGLYPFGTGLVTVTGCSGNSWVASGNANGNAGASQNWAVGTGNGTALTNAYNAAVAAGKILALPCGPMIVETNAPFTNGTMSVFQQQADVVGCAATGGTHIFMHPNISAAVLANGGPLLANFTFSNSTGAIGISGGGGQWKIQDLFITSLGGQIPGTAAKVYTVLQGMGHTDGIVMQLVGMSNGTLIGVGNNSGENHHRHLNFQNFVSNGTTAYFGVQMGGQGANSVLDSVFAFVGIQQAIQCVNTFCESDNNYITGTQQGIVCSSGACTMKVVGTICAVAGGGGSHGCISDGSNSGSITYSYGNILSTSQASFPVLTVGGIMDMSGTQVTCPTSGFCASGTGVINDRAGNTYSSPLTQFTGVINFIGGGSMVTTPLPVNTNFGTGIGTITLIASVLSTTPMGVYLDLRQTTLGTGACSGAGTEQATLTYTLPNGTVTTKTTNTLSITGVGVTDTDAGAQEFLFTAKAGTAITVSTTTNTAPTGCTTLPQYVLDIKAGTN
jgi:hypothetical protein